ncbi:hypothetical protein ACN20G_01460 [Streptomyces sp. BI20]|uniref:hypothetical protein n=1 Tax=Streptomyces sp. BI20 TaxID=3403460 RepID=UPI003C77FC52
MRQPPAPAPAPSRRTLLAALAPLLLAGCAAEDAPTHPAPGPAAAPDAVVLLLRNAEEPVPGDVGEGDDGEEDAGSLASRGRRRAEALPELFAPARAGRPPRPTALFAAGGLPRCRQTLTPLAGALRLPLRGPDGPGRERETAAAALAAKGPVLICWDRPALPKLVRALGADRAVGLPADWPDRFDVLWTLTRTAGVWTFRETPQHLLPGDA